MRPLGPSVTLTASASWFIPRSRPRRASSSKAMILLMPGVPPRRRAVGGRNGARDGRPAAPGSRPRGPQASPDRPGSFAPGSSCHSRLESANAMLALSPVECKPPRPRPPRADGRTRARGGHPPRALLTSCPSCSRSSRLVPTCSCACVVAPVRVRARSRPADPSAPADLELDPLPLLEGPVAVRDDGGVVDEHVGTTVVDGDEAVSLLGVEPLSRCPEPLPSPGAAASGRRLRRAPDTGLTLPAATRPWARSDVRSRGGVLLELIDRGSD